MQFPAARYSHSRVAFLLPRIPLSLTAQRPDALYRNRLTIGGKLARRRHELGLTQAEAAAQMGVSEFSLLKWERDGHEPTDAMYPAFIAFLGYEPWPEPTTLAGALRAERRRRGWAMKVASRNIGVDEGTWRRWETGEWRPTRRTAAQLDAFLGYPAKRQFPDALR